MAAPGDTHTFSLIQSAGWTVGEEPGKIAGLGQCGVSPDLYAENTDMNGTCDGTNTAVLKIGFTLFISLKYVENGVC